MMRKLMAVLTAVMMVLAMGIAAAEPVPFSLGGTFTWGMDEAAVLDALGDAEVYKEEAELLTYLDPDGTFAFEGLECWMTLGLKEDRLVMAALDFTDEVTARSVKDALTALYGEGMDVTDPAAYADLDAMSDDDVIDLQGDPRGRAAMWAAEDGTRVLVLAEADDGEADAIFYMAGE